MRIDLITIYWFVSLASPRFTVTRCRGTLSWYMLSADVRCAVRSRLHRRIGRRRRTAADGSASWQHEQSLRCRVSRSDAARRPTVAAQGPRPADKDRQAGAHVGRWPALDVFATLSLSDRVSGSRAPPDSRVAYTDYLYWYNWTVGRGNSSLYWNGVILGSLVVTRGTGNQASLFILASTIFIRF